MSTKGIDHWGDLLVVVVYFTFIFGIGLWTLCRPNRGNVSSYFLAGRSMPWFAVGASIFSSNIGSEHFVGLAGAGASSGIVLVLYEWFVIFLILSCAWAFLPVYISAGVFTLPEYLHKRHDSNRIRVYLTCLALVSYILSKLAVSIFSGSLFIQMALGWDMYASIIALLVITGVFTVLGGLTAVMYTDTFQTSIMMIGALIVTGLGFSKVGGMAGLQSKYLTSMPSIRNENTTCGQPKSDAFHLFLDPVNSDYPWPAIVIMTTFGGMWYWCCDQMIVQRSLAAKDLANAKGGSILAGYFKMSIMFILVMPGMISRVLFPDDVACTDSAVCEKVCENPVGCSNIAYPKLVLELLPYGLRGLLMVVMFSANMSSLTSIFNSASTIFTMDIWRRIRRNVSQRELLIVGRLFVVFMCGISILWLPLVKSSSGGKLFTYMTAVEGYINAPLGIVFLFSVFWKRTTEMAIFISMICANTIGGIRLVLEFIFPAPACGEIDTRPLVLSKVNYLYFGVGLLFVTASMIVVISLLTPKREPQDLIGLTWWTRYGKTQEMDSDIQVQDVEMESKQNTDVNGDPKIQEDQTNEGIVPSDKNHKSIHNTQDNAQDVSIKKKILQFLFGQTVVQRVAEFSVAERNKFLKQNRKQNMLLNINAIILMIVVIFLTAYFH